MTGPVVALDPAPVGTVAVVELRWVRLELLEPFVAAHGTEHDREVVLVRVGGTDDVAGWGECVALSAATYSPETTATAWVALRDVLVPAVLGGGTVPVDAHPMACTAIETALVDLALRREDRSLTDAFGARRRPLDACAVVGMQPTIDAAVAAVGRRVAEGYRSVKLKIEPGHDLATLAAVRVAHPDLAIAADANGSFTFDDRRRLESLGAVGLDYLEQPLPAGDLEGSARLRRALPYPVALDESIASLADLEQAVRAEAGSIVNLKPGRVGGLAASHAILERAVDEGWGAFVGGMLETGVGRAVALAVASHEACDRPTDLGPSARYFRRDLTEPIVLDDGGCLAAPDGPGIGVAPFADRLDAATVDRCEIHP